MAKMTVIYKTPKHIAIFEKHYFEVHVPLAMQLPGLLKGEINEGSISSKTGHSDVNRIANLYFESKDTIMDSFKSEIGQLCASYRKILADNEAVQIYVYETKPL